MIRDPRDSAPSLAPDPGASRRPRHRRRPDRRDRRGDRAAAGRGRLGRRDDPLDAVRRPDAVGPARRGPGDGRGGLAAAGRPHHRRAGRPDRRTLRGRGVRRASRRTRPGHRAGDVPLPSRSTPACSTPPSRASTGTTRSTCGRPGCWSRSTPSGSPRPTTGTGRIVALTSDHVVHNLPYGSTQGRAGPAGGRGRPRAGAPAADRERGQPRAGRHRLDGRRAARADPAETPSAAAARPPTPRPWCRSCCSPDGGWVNGQVLCSDGGLHVLSRLHGRAS